MRIKINGKPISFEYINNKISTYKKYMIFMKRNMLIMIIMKI